MTINHVALSAALKTAGCTSPDGTFVHASMQDVLAALSRASEAVACRWMVEETLSSGSVRWKVYEHEHQAREAVNAGPERKLLPLYATPPAPTTGKKGE